MDGGKPISLLGNLLEAIQPLGLSQHFKYKPFIKICHTPLLAHQVTNNLYRIVEVNQQIN
jgi:hypothetical protein